MTQALINTLNTLSEKKVNLTEKMSKNTGMDFGKIFETKTGTFSSKVKDVTKNADSVKTKNIKQDFNDACESQQKITQSDNKDDNITTNIKTDNNIENEEQEEKSVYGLLNAAIQKFSKEESDTVQEAVLEDEDISEELITDIIEESDITEESTTITEEDPTMYNELTTLENPTAVIMLQSQIQQGIKTAVLNEQTDISEDVVSSELTKSQNQNNSESTAIFKQFDRTTAKDVNVLSFSPKEIIHQKSESSKTSNLINENIVKELNVEVVSSQARDAESSMGDLMQNQSPQEQTARIMIQGDVKYETTAAEAAKNVSQVKTENITPSKIIDQISKQLEGMVNNSKLNMVLNPGTLGKLNLQLINSKEGLIAQFTVTTPEARDALMKGLEGLKESLLAQGVNVDNVSVKLEENEGEQELDYKDQEGSRGGNKHQRAKKQKEDGSDFEEMMFNLENEENV